MKIKFIVFDGIDGCGSGTIGKLLRDYLKSKGLKVFLTHDPNKNLSLGKKIRELLEKKSSEKYTRQFWLTLFTQSRHELIEKIIKPKLERSYIVICDRYYYSTLAYQLNEKEWKDYLNKYRFLKPDIAFILDVAPVISLKRTKKRQRKTIFEKEKFLEKVREKFIKIYKKRKLLNENIWLIDASQPKAKVFSDVKKIIEKLI